MIKTYQLATANQAAQKLSGKLRSLIGVFGLGVVLLFIVISIAEAMGKGRTEPSAGKASAARTKVKAQPVDQTESEPVAGLSRYRFQSRSDANR
jgi:Na+-transporting methylmalonyl-CoA/oxaloacetate decarboxylase gamma subunit